MAKCPKCQYHLRLIDAGQHCPKCGVNMRFYNFEENFYREAKIAELSNAGIIAKLRRLKAAFIGSKLTIARLCVMLLPVLGFLVSSGRFSADLVAKKLDVDLSIMGLIPVFSDGSLQFILSMLHSEVLGSAFSSLFLSLALIAVTVVMELGVLLTSILCFLSVKNMQKITFAFSIGGIASALSSAIFIIVKSNSVNSGLVTYNAGFGLFVVALLFVAPLVVNLLLIKKGIDVVYDEGMLERVEIYEKVKKGEINIDDLPQPVVETEETRQITAEIDKERNAFLEKYGQKEEA